MIRRESLQREVATNDVLLTSIGSIQIRMNPRCLTMTIKGIHSRCGFGDFLYDLLLLPLSLARLSRPVDTWTSNDGSSTKSMFYTKFFRHRLISKMYNTALAICWFLTTSHRLCGGENFASDCYRLSIIIFVVFSRISTSSTQWLRHLLHYFDFFMILFFDLELLLQHPLVARHISPKCPLPLHLLHFFLKAGHDFVPWCVRPHLLQSNVLKVDFEFF